VGNPIAGIDPIEIVDTRQFCIDFTNKLTNNGNGNPEYSNRKTHLTLTICWLHGALSLALPQGV
jgi:hypothetical protein